MKFTITDEPNDIEKAHPEDMPFKVKLGDIECRKTLTKNNPLKFFKLRMLRKSLKEKGYDPKTFGYISLTYDSTIDKYMTFDGNHRLSVLKEVYDDDYEIEATRHIPCEECGEVEWDLPIAAHTSNVIFYYVHIITNNYNGYNFFIYYTTIYQILKYT